MKKLIFFLLIVLSLVVTGCEFVTGHHDDKYYTLVRVTLVDSLTNNETQVSVSKGKCSLNHFDAGLKEGYLFLGWSLDGETIIDGDEVTAYEGLKLYSIWEETADTNPYEAFFEVGSVAKIEITAEAEITSKEDYVASTITITDEGYELKNAVANIRLRGNSSLNAPKKSYKIKFDKKQDLFGFGSDKEWALIANYYDPSMVRNFYAYRLALAMEMEYAVQCKFAEVYLNGELLGLYLLCETVKTGNNRVNIEVDYDANETDIPYLLELDFKMTSPDDPASNGVENIDYFNLNLRTYGGKVYPIACKYPKDYERITDEQFEIIKQEVRNAFVSTVRGDYAEYFDVDSLIDYFIIQELMMNIDVDYSSVFFYKAQGGKIKMGPVWDFDISSGNCNYVNNYTAEVLMKDVNGGSFLLNHLLTNSEFKAAFNKRLEELNEKILPAMFASFEDTFQALQAYELRDNNVWHNLFQEYWPKPYYLVGPTYYQQVLYVRSYLQRHYRVMLELTK